MLDCAGCSFDAAAGGPFALRVKWRPLCEGVSLGEWVLLAGEKKQMERQPGAEVTFHVLHYGQTALHPPIYPLKSIYGSPVLSKSY